MATHASPELDEFDSDYELDSSVNPSSVDDAYSVTCSPPWEHQLGETYGKWMVFKPMVTDELDDTWHTIAKCVENGEFGEGCTGAKSSTARENPDEAPIGSPNGVICVCTTKEAVDNIGLQLIQKVRQTIRYKTDETTLAGRYAHKGHGKVTERTLYWNDGQPIFGPRTLPADVNPTSVTDDYWVSCKPPSATDEATKVAYNGKWVIFEPMVSLNKTWHRIRQAVESGEFGKGCISARSTTAFRPYPMSPDSDGQIQVATTEEGMKEVGMKIINKLKCDIQYRHKKVEGPPQVHQNHGEPPLKTWLYWNDGKPSDSTNPTSITDKHWVHCKPPSTPAVAYHGKWQIFEPMASLDETWHVIRGSVESGEFGEGCIGARCSTALKPDHLTPDSDGVIQVSTTEEGMDEVGMKLINKVERDIQYRHGEEEGPQRVGQYHRRRPMLYWNNGEPSFHKL